MRGHTGWLAALGILAIALDPALASAETIAAPESAPAGTSAQIASAPAPTVLVPATPGAPALTAPGPAAPPPAPAPSAPAQVAPAPVIDEAEQVRGFSCFAGGLFAAAGAWAFSELVAAATAGGSSWPVTLPLMAAAFVTGCTVGSMSLPAFYALLSRPSR